VFSRCLEDEEAKTEEIVAADESSGQQAVDDSLRNKLSLVEDDLPMDTETVSVAAGSKQARDASMETEVERTITGDDLPTSPDNLLAEITKQETSSAEMISAESAPEPVKMDSREDECVNATETANCTGELV